MSYTSKYLQFIAEAAKKSNKSDDLDPISSQMPNIPARPSWMRQPKPKQQDNTFYTELSDIIKATGYDIRFTEHGLVEVDYSSLNDVLDVLDDLKSKKNLGYSAIVYGEAGIGKSAIMQTRAKQRAAELQREFITISDFLKISPDVKAVQKNISKYFIYIDERAGGFDPSMMTGIPDPTSPERKGYLTELPSSWVAIMSMSPDAAGFLFLDELNQGDERVQNALFSLLNFEERTIAGKYPIQGDWRIHAAGNWGEGYSIIDLVPALKERLAPYYLTIDFQGWAKWAYKTKIEGTDKLIIHPVLMEFIEEDPDKNFYERPTKSSDPTKRPNPRNLVALSAAMYSIFDEGQQNSSKWAKLIALASSICGSGFGKDFEQFLRSNAIINVGDILADPSAITSGRGSSRNKESDVMQRLSVFKRNIKKLVITFDDKMAAAKTDEEKEDLAQLASEYLYVLNYTYHVEPATAVSIFSVIANDKMRRDLMLFLSAYTKYAKLRGNNEMITYANEIQKKIVSEVGGNMKAFASGDEDAETIHHIPAQAVDKLASILNRFDSKMQQIGYADQITSY